MATYAAYRHVELDKIGQGKKRVLKPPGGGSSISFADDDSTQNVSQDSPQASSPTLSDSDHVPSSNAESSEVEKSSTVTTPSHEESNGMIPETKVSVQPDTFTSNDKSLPVKSVIINGKDEEPSKCDNISDSSSVQPESEKAGPERSRISSSSSDTVNESVVINAERSVSSTSTENGVHRVNGNCVDALNDLSLELVNSNGVYDKKENIVREATSNGAVKSPNVAVYQTTAVTSPLFSLSPASPSMRPNEDTRDRVIGQPIVSITPPSAQPRKIKDHMRSSIIMSDEDYTPTRSSRINATVSDTTPENVPAAGQRQRIPPGGFSSKLW